MAQINCNINHSIKSYKNEIMKVDLFLSKYKVNAMKVDLFLSHYKSNINEQIFKLRKYDRFHSMAIVKEVQEPIRTNFNGYSTYGATPYVEDYILKFPSVEDDDYSIIYIWLKNVIKIEFEWKVDCEVGDTALYFRFDEEILIDGTTDWEKKILTFDGENGYIYFGFSKVSSSSDGEGTGYFRNIKIYSSIVKDVAGQIIRENIEDYKNNNSKIDYIHKTFKNYKEIKKTEEIEEEVNETEKNPPLTDLEDFNQINPNKPFSATDGIYSNADLEDVDYGISGVIKELKGVKSISFDWKVSSEEDCDYLAYGTEPLDFDIDYDDEDEREDLCDDLEDYCLNKISDETDWETVTLENLGDVKFWFVYFKDGSSDDYDDTGYIKNINIVFEEDNDSEDNDSENIENGNYLSYEMIKQFKNKYNRSFCRLGRDFSTPSKRITFRNFED